MRHELAISYRGTGRSMIGQISAEERQGLKVSVMFVFGESVVLNMTRVVR